MPISDLLVNLNNSQLQTTNNALYQVIKGIIDGFPGSPTSSSNITISNTAPQITFIETDQGFNLKDWTILVDGGIFYLQTLADDKSGLINILKIDRTGILALPVGQIQFPAAQNPSSNANTLDDYEEGGWTPVDASGAGLGLTNVVPATYIKIGREVYIHATVQYPANANGLGAFIGGLPFGCSVVQDGSCFYRFVIAGPKIPMGFIRANQTIIQLYDSTTGVQFTNAQLTGSVHYFSGMYEATA